MTRPWTIASIGGTVYYTLLYFGESIGKGFTSPVAANAEADRRNQQAEAWRIMRNKEEREARKK